MSKNETLTFVACMTHSFRGGQVLVGSLAGAAALEKISSVSKG